MDSLTLNSVLLHIVSKPLLSSSCFLQVYASFQKVVQFIVKVHRLSTYPSQKSWNPHTKTKLCLTKVRQSSQGTKVVPTLHTRHTPSANNKSPSDIKVPLPHSPQSKSPVGRRPDWTDVSATTSWGGVSLHQLWSTKRRNFQCQGPEAKNARGLPQEVKGPGIKKQLGASQLGRTVQKTPAPREVMSYSFFSFLRKLCKCKLAHFSWWEALFEERKCLGNVEFSPSC